MKNLHFAHSDVDGCKAKGSGQTVSASARKCTESLGKVVKELGVARYSMHVLATYGSSRGSSCLRRIGTEEEY